MTNHMTYCTQTTAGIEDAPLRVFSLRDLDKVYDILPVSNTSTTQGYEDDGDEDKENIVDSEEEEIDTGLTTDEEEDEEIDMDMLADTDMDSDGLLQIIEGPVPIDHCQDTYRIAGLMMYLIGVDKRSFLRHTPDLSEQYEMLSQDKDAIIIRDLCILRTVLLRHHNAIQTQFRYYMKDLSTLPELIPTEVVKELDQYGICLETSLPNAQKYQLTINRLIAERINEVKDLFPEWVDWGYIRPLFIMPNGMKPDGLKKACDRYNGDRNRYPYQCYMNWPYANNGNLLSSDRKFLTILYAEHHDTFEQPSLVHDVGDTVKEDMHSFLARSQNAMIMVDCENSDPVKLVAAMQEIAPDQKQKISKVILFDSEYTSAVWKALHNVGVFPDEVIERIEVPRIYEHKSQVDMTLATRTCKEVYLNGVDSVILVSSDSDYWALVQALEDVDFLVMLEHDKSGKKITDTLRENGYRYCYLDDFCTGSVYGIKTQALRQEIQGRLDAVITGINMREILDNAIHDTRIFMSNKEKELFYTNYIRSMHMDLASNGELTIRLGSGS